MVSEEKESLTTRVLKAVADIFNARPYQIPEEWFVLRLTMPQVRTIFLLLMEGPLRMSAVAFNLGITLPTSTGLIDRMVEKELVQRYTDPKNRRSVICELTSEGFGVGERLLALQRARWEQRIAPLDNKNLLKVAEAMELIQDILEFEPCAER